MKRQRERERERGRGTCLPRSHLYGRSGGILVRGLIRVQGAAVEVALVGGG